MLRPVLPSHTVAGMPRFHEQAKVPAAALLAVLFVMASAPVGSDERASLTQLHRVSLSVELAHPLPSMTAEGLTAHLVSTLRGAGPSLTIRDSLPDRIRLIVSVRPISATTLRGFWLPFSGTYGIGAVRLGVERMVTLPGVPGAVPAVVWQAERTVGSRWAVIDGEIRRLVDELTAELAKRRRQQP